MAGNSIVVGVDQSPESLRAVELAARLAAAAHAQVVPVHAVPAVPLFTGLVGIEPMPAFSPEVQEALNRASREEILRALRNVLPPAAVQRLVVQTGPAPFVIAEVARQRRAELVVLGGKEHGALARGLGRSTAHYLVRTLDVPVLVVGRSAAPVARVLVAVDLSAASLPTVRAAERFAKLLGGRLRVVHVVEPLRLIYLPLDTLDQEGFDRRSREAFDRLGARLKSIPPEDRVVRTGPPAETIAEEAATWRADLLVVGSHGKGWVDRILVGSTTERLVTELPTSILVIPFKPTRKVTLRRRSRRRVSRRATRRAVSV